MNAARPDTYPTSTTAAIFDDFFGQKVADPYRWLEDLNSEQTSNWLESQQKLTRCYFEKLPTATIRQTLDQRLTNLWHHPKYSVVAQEGPYYFFWGRSLTSTSTHTQAILYRKNDLKGESVAVLDLNKLDPTGYTSVTSQAFSSDGQFMAYALTNHGSDWQTLKIRNTLTLIDFPEKLEGIKLASVAWQHDNSGFYYNCFWPLQTGPREDGELYSCVFWHFPGTPQAEDILIYRCSEPAGSLSVYPQITDDGEYLVLTILAGAAPTNQVYYRKTSDSGSFIPLLDGNKAGYIFLGNRGNIFYFQTDQAAGRGKVIGIDILQPDPANWQVVVEEMTAVLDFGIVAAGQLVLVYLEKNRHILRTYSMAGTFKKELALPLTGSVTGLTGRYEHEGIFLSLENFHCPASIYHYSFETEAFELIFQPLTEVPEKGFETHQILYPGLDGTLITLDLVHKTGLVLDGNNPTILYGYGGFGQKITPSYWLSQQLWLEQGGVLAIANIRGGGENGQAWHEAARRGKRQTAIDDFCQAARYLIEAGYTKPTCLGIWGASNGGLLVAACLTQKPELFGAAICQAPLTDMLRYQNFGAGQSWTTEFGDATASPAEFEWLFAYSPLHNVKKQNYPAMLVTVALGDERVHPMHGMKFMATLQAHHLGDKPVLLRIDPENGHGLDKPEAQLIAETTDMYSFLFQSLGMPYPKRI